jgi:hypothetical protein
MRNLQEIFFEDIDYLFSPATKKQIKAIYNIQRDSPSPVASKKPTTSRGILVREVRPLRVRKAKQRGSGLRSEVETM